MGGGGGGQTLKNSGGYERSEEGKTSHQQSCGNRKSGTQTSGNSGQVEGEQGVGDGGREGQLRGSPGVEWGEHREQQWALGLPGGGGDHWDQQHSTGQTVAHRWHTVGWAQGGVPGVYGGSWGRCVHSEGRRECQLEPPQGVPSRPQRSVSPGVDAFSHHEIKESTVGKMRESNQ